jgi:hypothetical protein
MGSKHLNIEDKWGPSDITVLFRPIVRVRGARDIPLAVPGFVILTWTFVGTEWEGGTLGLRRNGGGRRST